MNRNLSKRPKVVRRLDGALTAWRYFHGPNFVHDVRARRMRKAWIYQYGAASVLREEGEALMRVLVRFVEWMQAPISPWAGSPFVTFIDEDGTRKVPRSNIARAMSKGRPGSPFYVTLIGERPLGASTTSIPKFYKAPR